MKFSLRPGNLILQMMGLPGLLTELRFTDGEALNMIAAIKQTRIEAKEHVNRGVLQLLK